MSKQKEQQITKNYFNILIIYFVNLGINKSQKNKQTQIKKIKKRTKVVSYKIISLLNIKMFY